MNAIIYTRVSTDDQKNYGYSLPHQKFVLEGFCKAMNYNIISHFQEDYSAKNFNRPEFNKLMAYVKANRKKVDLLLFTKWDRFSRNQYDAMRMMRSLRDLGVQVNAAEQPLDLSNPDSKVLLSIYLTLPEIENDKNSIRTKEGMRRAAREGYWVGSAPFGYKNVRNEYKKPTLLPNEKAPLVIKAFEEMAKEIYSAEEIRKRLYKHGLKLVKQAFLNLLRNPVYIGKIYISPWRKEDAMLVDGIHPPLVTDEVFQKVNDILSGKKKSTLKGRSSDEQFYLRGFLSCPICNGSLTGSQSTGNGGHYSYYHCNYSDHKVRFRVEKANQDFVKFLGSFKPSMDVVLVYRNVLKEIEHEKGKEKQTRLNHLDNEISKTVDLINSADERYLTNDLSKEAYARIIDRYNQKVNELSIERELLVKTETHFERHIQFGVNLLSNLTEIFENAPGEVKRKIIGLFFPEKLQYENSTYRTKKINEGLALIVQLSSLMGGVKIKQAGISASLSTLAPPAGLEPATL
jgi:site-specific DNA recombinase